MMEMVLSTLRGDWRTERMGIRHSGCPCRCVTEGRMFRQCVFAVSLVLVFLGSAAVAQSQTPTDRGSVVPTAGVTKTVNGSGAQVAAESDTVGPSIFEDIRDDFRRFFTTRDVYLGLGLGFGVSMGLKPLDDNVAASGFNTELPANADRTLDRIFESGEILGSTWVQMGGAGLIYGLGWLSGQSGVAGLGRDLVRAQLLTQGVTQVSKYAVRRLRQDGSSRTSFPSGHASASFATAAVLQRRYGWKVGGPALAMASYVAASRLSESRHFVSDVAFGAAIGLVAGRTVTFDRGRTRVTVAPVAPQGSVGVSLSLSRRE